VNLLEYGLIPKLKVTSLPDHKYAVNEYPAPSISEIVDVIIPRFNSVGAEAAMMFGQTVHAAIHYDLEGDLMEDSVNQEVFGCVKSARKWIEKNKLTLLLVESVVGSLDPLVAGRIDSLFVNPKGEFWMPDWKTGYRYTTNYEVRLAAYEFCFRQTYGKKTTKRMAVYLDEDGDEPNAELYTNPFHFHVFKAAHVIWSWREINKRKGK
jgi:hypothetical protein